MYSANATAVQPYSNQGLRFLSTSQAITPHNTTNSNGDALSKLMAIHALSTCSSVAFPPPTIIAMPPKARPMKPINTARLSIIRVWITRIIPTMILAILRIPTSSFYILHLSFIILRS
jgi:hypothetical protein